MNRLGVALTREPPLGHPLAVTPSMKLNYREYGTYREDRPSLVLLHGLLGSSSNWHSIARALEPDYHLIVPDLRNHGSSPHDPEGGYPALAEDVAALIDDHGLESVILIGHSMGGKAAMWLSLQQPELVDGLVVVDVSPVRYPNRFGTIFDALCSLDLESLQDRNQADGELARLLEPKALRNYLLQNLVQEKGRWRWRVNLDAIGRNLERIIGFPDVSDSSQYLGPVQFLYGGNSDYVLPEHEKIIRDAFPFARLRSIAGAGHWVYSEKPEQFLQALQGFLQKELL
ncbi:MAG: alpha/beta fold hydrolase [Sedimenticola sp.]